MPSQKLTDDQYEFIKNEVVALFLKYDVKCIPVSGFEIASKMGMSLVAYSSLSEEKLKLARRVSDDGFYFEFEGKEGIFYNDIDKSYERQNMTLLHEIGHCVLDHTGNGEDEEAEAKFFAKYAIAPPILIHKIGAQSYYDIIDHFDISMQAAVYAWGYYQKWLRFHYSIEELTPYEKKLLIFSEKVA